MTVVDPIDVTTGVRELRSSPLARRAAEFAEHSAEGPRGVRLVEEPFHTQVDLRVHPDSPAIARVEQALEIALPHHTPNRVTGDQQHAVLWLGPSEWLVVAPDGQVGRIRESVQHALGEAPGSVVDVSANRTMLRLSGSRARDVLEKLCSLDLHPREFGPGQCAQTLIGRTQVILWQVGAEPSYRIMVRCSYAHYLADLLVDGMAEFTTG